MGKVLPPPNQIVIPFIPRTWQREVFNKLRRNNVLVVHRGAGKTELCVNVVNKAAITGPRDADYAYILPQFNQAARVVWKPLQRCSGVVPGIEYNNQTLVVRYPNGARIFVLGADNPDTLRGMHLHGVVLDEFSEMHRDTWTVVRPMLTNHKGWCIWIGTPKGHNEFYNKYAQSQDPEAIQRGWYGELLSWKDTNALDPDEVEAIRFDMPPEIFAQEMECSFNSAMLGAYWAAELDKLYSAKRIVTTNLFRPDLQVHTSWDLGIGDAMSVWFYQQVGDDVHLIDFEENQHLGFPEWANILQYRSQKFHYRYGTHWAPHDIRNRELATGVNRIDSALRLGIKFTQVPPTKPMDGILLVRQELHRCRFDSARCSEGIRHLRDYKSKLDKLGNDLGPLHDEHSHAADSFRYMWAGIDSLKPRPVTVTRGGRMR